MTSLDGEIKIFLVEVIEISISPEIEHEDVISARTIIYFRQSLSKNILEPLNH